jgi:hypothetical protein
MRLVVGVCLFGYICCAAGGATSSAIRNSDSQWIQVRLGGREVSGNSSKNVMQLMIHEPEGHKLGSGAYLSVLEYLSDGIKEVAKNWGEEGEENMQGEGIYWNIRRDSPDGRVKCFLCFTLIVASESELGRAVFSSAVSEILNKVAELTRSGNYELDVDRINRKVNKKRLSLEENGDCLGYIFKKGGKVVLTMHADISATEKEEILRRVGKFGHGGGFTHMKLCTAGDVIVTCISTASELDGALCIYFDRINLEP